MKYVMYGLIVFCLSTQTASSQIEWYTDEYGDEYVDEQEDEQHVKCLKHLNTCYVGCDNTYRYNSSFWYLCRNKCTEQYERCTPREN